MSNKYVEAIVKAEEAYPEKDFASSALVYFDDPAELYRITEAYCLIGLFENACSLYKRIIELNPAWIDILDLYARALWALHDYEGAKRLWKLFLEKRQAIYRK